MNQEKYLSPPSFSVTNQENNCMYIKLTMEINAKLLLKSRQQNSKWISRNGLNYSFINDIKHKNFFSFLFPIAGKAQVNLTSYRKQFSARMNPTVLMHKIQNK